jgi:hypothetical protein
MAAAYLDIYQQLTDAPVGRVAPHHHQDDDHTQEERPRACAS